MQKILKYILFLLLCSIARGQVSPGELSKVHAYLEGNSCTKCHVSGKQLYYAKCLDCHSEIKNLINAGKGYHSHSEVRGKNCWNCHSEHRGRNYHLVNFYEELFKHYKTQFPLTGKHKEINCGSCHQSEFISDNKIRNRAKTYLGLDIKCSSCHEDFHQGTLSGSCDFCHGTDSFNPAPKFSHDRTQFILSGAHQKAECASCHPVTRRSGKKFQQFKGTAAAGCISCHRDVHGGKFGNQCQSCHTVNSFNEINRNRFDHSKTNFPLIGLHQKVNCSGCHTRGLTVQINHNNCTDCHSDFHRGEFISSAKSFECSACHSVNSFAPSLFTIDDHNNSNFKLTGSHLAVSCKSCHLTSSGWKFSITETCINCHQNNHGADLSDLINTNGCENCHQTKSWEAISFDHNSTGFPLLDKHQKIRCGNCHQNKEAAAAKSFVFSITNENCETCHQDIHAGQFALNGLNDCLSCHTFENWIPNNFDHEKTRFPLSGAHSKLKCSACHNEIEKNGVKFIRFKLEYFRCAACHL